MAGLIAPWKSMAMSTSSPASLRSSANFSAAYWTSAGVSTYRGRRRLGRLRLEGGKALCQAPLDRIYAVRMGVDAHPLPRRAAEQLVDRHAQRLALDVPQGHVDAAQGAGEHRAAAIEGVAVDRLPVMDHLARVFAHQVRLDFLDGGRDGRRPALDDRLAQPDDPGIGVHLQEQPARLDQQGFQLRDPKRVPGRDRGLDRERGPGPPPGLDRARPSPDLLMKRRRHGGG